MVSNTWLKTPCCNYSFVIDTDSFVDGQPCSAPGKGPVFTTQRDWHNVSCPVKCHNCGRLYKPFTDEEMEADDKAAEEYCSIAFKGVRGAFAAFAEEMKDKDSKE